METKENPNQLPEKKKPDRLKPLHYIGIGFLIASIAWYVGLNYLDYFKNKRDQIKTALASSYTDPSRLAAEAASRTLDSASLMNSSDALRCSRAADTLEKKVLEDSMNHVASSTKGSGSLASGSYPVDDLAYTSNGGENKSVQPAKKKKVRSIGGHQDGLSVSPSEETPEIASAYVPKTKEITREKLNQINHYFDSMKAEEKSSVADASGAGVDSHPDVAEKPAYVPGKKKTDELRLPKGVSPSEYNGVLDMIKNYFIEIGGTDTTEVTGEWEDPRIFDISPDLKINAFGFDAYVRDIYNKVNHRPLTADMPVLKFPLWSSVLYNIAQRSKGCFSDTLFNEKDDQSNFIFLMPGDPSCNK